MRGISLSRFLIDEQWQKHAIPHRFPKGEYLPLFDLLNVAPTSPHQRIAVLLDSKHEVELAMRYHHG